MISAAGGYFSTGRSDHDRVTDRGGAVAAGLLAELLCRARYTDGTVTTKRGPVDLKRGDALVSVTGLAKTLKIPRRNVQRLMDWFESDGIISTKTARSNRAVGDAVAAQSIAQSNAPFPTIVTLCHYDTYTATAVDRAQSIAQSNAGDARSSWHESAQVEERNQGNKEEKEESTSKAGGDEAAPSLAENVVLFSSSSEAPRTKKRQAAKQPPKAGKQPVDRDSHPYRLAELHLRLLREELANAHKSVKAEDWAGQLAPMIEDFGAETVERMIRFTRAKTTPTFFRQKTTPADLKKWADKIQIAMNDAASNHGNGNGAHGTNKQRLALEEIYEHFPQQ